MSARVTARAEESTGTDPAADAVDPVPHQASAEDLNGRRREANTTRGSGSRTAGLDPSAHVGFQRRSGAAGWLLSWSRNAAAAAAEWWRQSVAMRSGFGTVAS